MLDFDFVEIKIIWWFIDEYPYRTSINKQLECVNHHMK